MSATKDLTKVAGGVAVVAGAASALGGVVDSIGSSLKGIGAAVDSLFSSPSVGLYDAPFTLPMPNPLNSYSSYDYIIGMTCLTTEEFNFPDTTYLAGNIKGPWLFKGASSAPNNRVKIDGTLLEFYCTDLNIKGQYGFEKGTGNTNSTNIEFTIVEPYSMGQFMMAVQVAARNKGYKNYNEAPFLLTIEFRGQDQFGAFKAVPLTKKYIPFNFNNMNIKVSGAGSVYQCVALPANAPTLMDSVRLLKSDTTIKGKTVQEILQTGPNSLQAFLNARTEEQKKQKVVTVPDEYVILFPTDIASSGANGASQASSANAKENDTTAVLDTATTFTDGKVLQKLNLTRSSVNKTLVQPDGDCNDIGKAGLGYDITRPQDKSFNEDKNTVDEKGNRVRSTVSATPVGQVDFSFAINSDIVNVINQVLLKSDIAKAALNRPPDTNGMRPWWRIDVQTYHITNGPLDPKTGSVPKLHVYRVVPYQVHASRLLAPNAKAPGIEQLKKQAAKEYNYIYTGKNTDVIRFEIDISNTFYQVFQADNYTTSGDVKNADSDGGAESGRSGTNPDKEQAPKTPSGGDPSPGMMATMSKAVATLFSTDNKGGSKGETQETRVARMFHDAMLNGMDMMNITMDIVGDPYFIANSGAGNYTATQTNLINVTKDGNINYQNGEVDIVINFRTPNDLNQATGLYNLSNTKLATQFSGLYKITTISSTFKNGKFTQTIFCNRRQGQDDKAVESTSSLVSAKAIEVASQPDELRTAQEVQASMDLGDFAG